MATKNSNISTFFSNLQNQRAQNSAQPNGVTASNDVAREQAKEQAMMQAALIGGNFNSSPAVENALKTYNLLASEGETVAKNAGFKPETQDYRDFVDYYTYMMWPQDMPISYDDFYNANSKRLESIKAKQLEEQSKAERKKVDDFALAMQQYDPVTGLPYSELSTQSALDDARQSWNRFSGAIGGVANEAKNNYSAYNQYRKDNNLHWWENADGYALPNG